MLLWFVVLNTILPHRGPETLQLNGPWTWDKGDMGPYHSVVWCSLVLCTAWKLDHKKMVLWKGQENGEILWFVFEGIPEFCFRVVFSNHSLLLRLKHHLKRTVSLHNSCVAWILRPVVNLDAWKETTNLLPNSGFSWWRTPRKQSITPKTNPSNCSEIPDPPKHPQTDLAWCVHLLTWNVKTWRQIPHRRENDDFVASRLKAAMFAMPARNFWINISLWTQRRSNRIRFSVLVGQLDT